MHPFDPAQARAGQHLRGIDPSSLIAGRDELEQTRLDAQKQLITSGTKRHSSIVVNLNGTIIDGNHGVRAAVESGIGVDVLIMDFPFQPAFGPVANLPITRR